MQNDEILLKEYDTLRAEILAAMTNRNSILTYGLATIAILYSGVAALNITLLSSYLPTIILMVVAPLVSMFISLNWLGEYERMQRAGAFIMNLEKEINTLAGKDLLKWETHLRVNKKHMKYPYHSTTLFLSLINCLSYFVGMVMRTHSMEFYFGFTLLGCLIFILFHIYLTLQMKRCVK